MNDSQSGCEPKAPFQFLMFPVVYSIVFVLGFLGNLYALYMFMFKIRPRTSASVYIINLAIADTAFVFTLPFRIHYHLSGNDWAFGDLACRVTGTVFYANIYISITFLTCICIDRYVATVHPFQYLSLQRTRCSLVVSLAVWAITTGASVAFIVVGPLEIEPAQGRAGQRSCFDNFSKQEWGSRLAAYSVCSLVFGSLAPFAVILVCYPIVMRRIARIHTGTSRRALRVIYAILAITVLCFLPYHVVHLLYLLMRHGTIRHCAHITAIYQARRVTVALVAINSCLDPVLYYFTTNYCTWRPCRWLRPRRTRGVYTISNKL